MDPLSVLGTGHFSQLLASALDVGDKPASEEEAAKVSHSPSSGHLANDVDVVSKQQSSVQQMKTAVHSHLTSQLTSDFIEGLRPMVNSGKLQIATYIPLQGEEEPAFIGNYPSIQAAVRAQRQSHALVGRLPGPIAKKLIQAQLANVLSAPHATAAAEDTPSVVDTDTAATSDKGQSGAATDQAKHGLSAAGDVAPGSLAPDNSTEADVPAATQKQQQQQVDLPQATAGEAAAAQADPVLPPSAGESTAPTTAAAAAAGSGLAAVTEAAAVTAEEVVAAKADRDPATVSAADDDAATAAASLLTKTAATAATAADAQPAGTSTAPVAPGNDIGASLAATAANSGSAAAAAAAAAQPLSALTDDVINLLLRKGLNALSAVAHTRESENGEWPQQQQPQHSGEAAAAQLTNQETPLSATDVPAGGDSSTYAQGQYMPAAGAEGSLAVADFQQYQQQLQGYGGALPYGTDMPTGTGPAAAAAAAASGGAEGAGAMEGMLEYAAPHTGQYRASTGGHLPPRPALNEPWGAAGMQAGGTAAAGLGGCAGFPAGAFPPGAFPQDPYGMPQSADMFDRRPRTSSAAGDTGFGGYSRDWSEYGNGMYGAAAAAQPASSGDKRKRSDPRLNCIKSVQYRVSRFPAELHDMCVEHWERTRCARVVCNGVNGVMSVQGGRCVVSFTQHGQEVLKGVADYLRYAGEDRIKKWRRHVRMVDFPRPNNRTGELMTAEEFLCIVGYQSEQGGGKRPKYMNGAGGDAAVDVSD